MLADVGKSLTSMTFLYFHPVFMTRHYHRWYLFRLTCLPVTCNQQDTHILPVNTSAMQRM